MTKLLACPTSSFWSRIEPALLCSGKGRENVEGGKEGPHLDLTGLPSSRTILVAILFLSESWIHMLYTIATR